MGVQGFVADLIRRGIWLVADGDGLIVRPAARLTEVHRVAIRANKTALIEALTCATSPNTEPPSLLYALPIDVEALAEAIAKAPRSPIEDDFSLARIARTAVMAGRIIRILPETARQEAVSLCGSVSQRAIGAIHAGNYARAYQIVDTLIEKLKSLVPQ